MTQKKNPKKSSAPAASARDLLALTVRTGVQAGRAESTLKLGPVTARRVGSEDRRKLG